MVMAMSGIIREVGWIGKREKRRVGMIISSPSENCVKGVI